MVATSGARLLPETAVKTMIDELLPKTFILTPNIPEALLILKEAGQSPIELDTLQSLKDLAAAVHRLGPKYVLIKGGHLPLSKDHAVATANQERKIIANVLYGEDLTEVFESEYQSSRNTHGTGCSLACSCIHQHAVVWSRADSCSCHRLQSCDWPISVESSARCVSLCRGGYQPQRGLWQGQRASQSLSFGPSSAVRTVCIWEE